MDAMTSAKNECCHLEMNVSHERIMREKRKMQCWQSLFPAAHREYRSRSVQPQGQRPPVTSRSGPILDSQHGSASGGPGLVQRLSNSQLSFNTSSIASVFSQVPRLSTTGPLASAAGHHRSSQVSSSSSTLSLLFGKRSFSSGLVISGLSAAEGGNTSDTQSSSSVNIALGPSCRSSRATQVRWCLLRCFYNDIWNILLKRFQETKACQNRPLLAFRWYKADFVHFHHMLIPHFYHQSTLTKQRLIITFKHFEFIYNLE